MTAIETQKYMEQVHKEYAFSHEANQILQNKYTVGSARTTLSNAVKNGLVQTIRQYPQPVMYKRADVLALIGEKL